MAELYKVLAQSAPVATTATLFYTVPAITSTVVSTLVICNRGAAASTFRVSIRIGGAADATMQYLYFNVSIAREATFTATLGITLATTDQVYIYSSTNNLSFNLFGTEIT